MEHFLYPVFLVESRPDDAERIRGLLANSAFTLRVVDLNDEEVLQAQHGAILLDCTVRGLEVLRHMLYSHRLPIIALTRAEDGEAALDEGAWEYLVKDRLTHELLVRSLRYMHQQYQLAMQLERCIVELQASETRFHNVIARNSDGMLVVDEEGVIQFVNPAAVTLFGRSAEKLVGSQLGFPISAGEITELDVLHGRDDIVSVEMRVVETEWNERNAFLLSLRDITERRRTEQALNLAVKKNYQFAAAIASTSIGVIITDPSTPENGIIFVNNGFTHITGYTLEEALGKNCRFLQGKDTDPQMLAQIREAVRQQKHFTGTLLNYRKDGTPFWNEITINPVFDDEGNLINFVGLQNDVTMRKQAEQALLEQERLRVALEKEKELSQVKSTFMSTVSHEFRTPLAIIYSASELLDRYFEHLSPEQRRERLLSIKGQVKQIEEMLDEIALVMQAELKRMDFNPVPMDARHFCYLLAEEFRSTIGSQHHISFRAEDGPLEGLIDPRLLRHILTNLLSNAVKYSSPHTTIHFDLYRKNGEIVFSIQDEGIGIPAHEQKRLFEPFYRASNAEFIGGTGLGLKIVKDCVTLHGGTVTIASEVGRGTTCTVRLPAGL